MSTLHPLFAAITFSLLYNTLVILDVSEVTCVIARTMQEVWLLDVEPYSLFHSNGQLLIEQLVAVVWWQVNTIETVDKSN